MNGVCRAEAAVKEGGSDFLPPEDEGGIFTHRSHDTVSMNKVNVG